MRYVIALDAALRLFRERATVPVSTKLVAPTLLRSQALAHLYCAARRGEIDRAEAQAQLDQMRAFNIRLLGDRVLQKFAWDFAQGLGWEDTLTAEYVALTKLQADAFVTLDQGLAQAAATLVPVASCDQMLGERLPQPSPQGVLSLRTERRRYQLDGPLRDTPQIELIGIVRNRYGRGSEFTLIGQRDAFDPARFRPNLLPDRESNSTYPL